MAVNSNQFAPAAGDSIPELRRKADGMLAFLRENEGMLRKFPTGAVDERRALWQPLADLLARAAESPALADDARLEAQRVWAEECRHSARFVVAMCVHARSESARQRFAAEPRQLEALIADLEIARPASLRILPTEDLDEFRRLGFLRPGE
jgi:hypothetical protein